MDIKLLNQKELLINKLGDFIVNPNDSWLKVDPPIKLVQTQKVELREKGIQGIQKY